MQLSCVLGLTGAQNEHITHRNSHFSSLWNNSRTRRGPGHGEARGTNTRAGAAITTIQNPFLICTARVWLYPPLATSGDRTSVSLGISCKSAAKIPPSLLKISAPDAESPRPRSKPPTQRPGLLRRPQKYPNPCVFNQFSPCPAGNAPSGLSPWCCPFPEPDVARIEPPRGPTRHPQLEISHGTPIFALLSGTQFFFLIYFYLPPGRKRLLPWSYFPSSPGSPRWCTWSAGRRKNTQKRLIAYNPSWGVTTH